MKLPTLLLTLVFLTATLTAPAKSPDVLFIAVDDLNDWTGHLGGHPQARTPNIDRLVARGVNFTNAHCAAPACNPSRAALMSGLRPWQTGIYMNGHSAGGVLKDTLTINRHFLASGYQCFGGGKIYHGYGSEGRDDTWTKWMGLFPNDAKEPHNANGLDRSHFDWGVLAGKPEGMGDYKSTGWAIDMLKNAPAEQPLFLALGYIKPHLPWYVPQAYFDRFPLADIQLPVTKEGDLDDVPPSGKKMAGAEGDHASVLKGDQWRKAVQAYLATISFLDDQVGRLLAAVEASPRGKDLIIVWWTDHGWHLGEKEHWRKFALWEEATRTSFAISAPGLTKSGATCAAPVDYTSVYPTLCELAGLPVPAHVTGKSLVPLLKDPAAAWDGVAICTHGKGNHSARDARWRYIRYANGDEELYDHEKDPYEWTNLAGEVGMSAIKEKLAALLPAKDTEVPEVTGGGNEDEGQKPKKGGGKKKKKQAE
jgi:arylsulfatase A-like enzyme